MYKVCWKAVETWHAALNNHLFANTEVKGCGCKLGGLVFKNSPRDVLISEFLLDFFSVTPGKLS